MHWTSWLFDGGLRDRVGVKASKWITSHALLGRTVASNIRVNLIPPKELTARLQSWPIEPKARNAAAIGTYEVFPLLPWTSVSFVSVQMGFLGFQLKWSNSWLAHGSQICILQVQLHKETFSLSLRILRESSWPRWSQVPSGQETVARAGEFCNTNLASGK